MQISTYNNIFNKGFFIYAKLLSQQSAELYKNRQKQDAEQVFLRF
jgi:hypothetical protein